MPARIERKLMTCTCGCGQTFYDRNVWGHKKRYASGACGRRAKVMPTLREHYEEKVIRGDGDECWGWKGCLQAGYGFLAHNKKQMNAHRVAYELFIGPIPEGLCVCHKCDNPVCSNPDHLFLGTKGDNLRDMTRKGRNVGNLRHPRASVEKVLSMEGSGLSQAKIGQVVGMSQAQVSRIIRRELRTHGR